MKAIEKLPWAVARLIAFILKRTWNMESAMCQALMPVVGFVPKSVVCCRYRGSKYGECGVFRFQPDLMFECKVSQGEA